MIKIIIRFLVNALLIFLVSKYVLTENITLVNGFQSALVFSIILALINSTLGLVLRIIGFPINFLTLGLFSFLVTLLVIWVTDYLYNGIDVRGILAYIFIAFLPAITSVIVSEIKKK